VGEALDRVLEDAPRLRSITVDQGTEFQSRALEDWRIATACNSTSSAPASPRVSFLEKTLFSVPCDYSTHLELQGIAECLTIEFR
jgi:hypothetical protein